MNRWLLDLICCLTCRGDLRESGDALVCSRCSAKIPVRAGIPRFVPEEADYCENFGAQWNTFRKTQLDAFSQTGHSAQRFTAETGWTEPLNDALILDGGCGAGRFAVEAVKRGGRLVAVDMSNAIDACAATLKEHGFAEDRYALVQASILDLPFRAGAFERVYSLGVIQHTPDPERAIRCLGEQLKPGGRIAIWAYERSWRSWLGYKYWLRILSKRLPTDANWALSKALVDTFFPVARVLRQGPGFRFTSRLLPLAIPPVEAPDERLREWSLLDTFDNLAPAYDLPVTEKEVRQILTRTGFQEIERRATPGLAITALRQ